MHLLRVNSILAFLDGFADLVHNVNCTGNDEALSLESKVYGTTALVLEIYKRVAGQGQILDMLGSLATPLPPPPALISLEKYNGPVIYIYCKLIGQLASLGIAFEIHKNAPSQKGFIYREFESEHAKAVQHIQTLSKEMKDIMLGGTHPLSHSDAQPLSSSTIPVYVNPYFRGRSDELSALRDRLCSLSHSPATVCIHALPGMGKTQLAAQYCQKFGSQYFAVIWVAADGPTKVGQGLSDCAMKMQLVGTSLTTEPRRNAQALVSWLQTTDKQWLLVFDNVDDCMHIKDFWPLGGHGHIIMTSRNPYNAEFRGASPFPLAPLSLAESKDLFYHIVGEDKRGQAAQAMEAVIQQWEGVPLALFHIGSFIRHSHMDLHAFLRLYRESAAVIHAERCTADEYPHSIATAFSIFKLEGDMKTLLRVLCFLDPDTMPLPILLANFEFSNPLALTNEIGFYQTVNSLCNSGLVSQDNEALRVHRLVQSVGFSSMNRADREVTLNQVLSLIQGNFPLEVEGKPTWENWPQCGRCMPHVLFLAQKWRDTMGSEEQSAELASLLSTCTWYMIERGLFAEADPLLRLARTVCPDSERSTKASILFNLAGLRFECNRIQESLDLCQEVVVIREALLDPWDPQLGNTMYSIGIVYMENGQPEKGLECCRKAVQIHEACQAQGRHDGSPTALAYLDVGLCYWKLGQLDSAQKIIVKGLDLFASTTGKSSQKYGQALSYLALVKEAQNEMEEARDLTLQSLQICQENTPTQFKTGFGFHKKAGFLQREGKLGEALSCIRKAIEILNGTYDSVPRVARSMFKMSVILEDMESLDEAAVTRREADQLRKTITTFQYDKELTEEAFDTLIPSFLC